MNTQLIKAGHVAGYLVDDLSGAVAECPEHLKVALREILADAEELERQLDAFISEAEE
jgi:hypothetical protein